MKTLKKSNYHHKFGRLSLQWAISFGTPEVRISKGKTHWRCVRLKICKITKIIFKPDLYSAAL
jgi:hypothetical protein